MQTIKIPAYVTEKIVMTWLGDVSRAESYEIVLEEGAEVKILGLFLGVGAESYESYVKVVHRGENTKARIYARGVVFEKSKLDFSGMLRVERGAIGTDTYFDARFMILGNEAKAHTFPGLEIEENEIAKGGHAATVARMREEEMFYMMSRGLSRETAYALLVSGYFESVLSQIEDAQELQVREKLKLKLEKYLGVFDA
jgi:Fe-S cluster assembly scaffold protein SufB